MELLIHVDEFIGLDRDLADFPVDVVFGHLGYMRTDKGLAAPGFQALAQAACGRTQLGKAHRALPHFHGRPALCRRHAVCAGAAARRRPTRVVWGSDWPHVMLKGAMPNDGDLADLLSTWIPDEQLRRNVLVDNPARLYGF